MAWARTHGQKRVLPFHCSAGALAAPVGQGCSPSAAQPAPRGGRASRRLARCMPFLACSQPLGGFLPGTPPHALPCSHPVLTGSVPIPTLLVREEPIGTPDDPLGPDGVGLAFQMHCPPPRARPCTRPVHTPLSTGSFHLSCHPSAGPAPWRLGAGAGGGDDVTGGPCGDLHVTQRQPTGMHLVREVIRAGGACHLLPGRCLEGLFPSGRQGGRRAHPCGSGVSSHCVSLRTAPLVPLPAT